MVNDETLATEIKDAAYHGADIRPAWIGSHRAETALDSIKGIASWTNTHRSYYLNFVRDYMDHKGDVLDIGCGAGQATAMLRRYSNIAIGIDSDSAVIDFACKHNLGDNIIFTRGAFPDDFRAPAGYDYIFCVETMEHIPYEKQIAFLDAALGMLKPGGKMFITTPNETTCASPHIGLWSPEWSEKLAAHLGDRVERRGFFQNTEPTEWRAVEGTHRAWVLR